MNYNKLRILVKQTKVTNEELAFSIGMSKVGFEKMLKKETCTVETLEKLAEYFRKPIGYFFDQEDIIINEPVNDFPLPKNLNDTLSASDKDKLLESKDKTIESQDKTIESQDKIIEAKESIIRLLTEKYGISDSENHENGKFNSPRVKGFGAMHEHQVKILVRKIISELKTN